MVSAAHVEPQLRCSIQTAIPLVGMMRQQGHDVDALLGQIGLRVPDLQDPDLRIPLADARRLVECAVRVSGDAALGLHLAERTEPGSFSLFVYLAATSATPREAFQRSARYLRLLNDAMEISLDVDGDLTICSIRYDTAYAVPLTSAEAYVGTTVRLGRAVTGVDRPGEAWFMHEAPAYAPEYERVLGVPVRFGAPCNAMVGTQALLDAPLPHSNSSLCELLDAHARKLLARLPGSALADRVRCQIAEALPVGNPHADAVSETLGISPRTLRRRLRDEGTSHQQLLDEVREGLARSYFAEGSMTVMEVAFLLGFSDASAFHKAFRRWTSQSPGEFLRGPAGKTGQPGSW